MSGYGITTNSSGVCLISGTWSHGADGQLHGTYAAQMGDETIVEGALTALAINGKLVAEVTTTNGRLRFRGLPVSNQPDLSGDWLAVVEVLSISDSRLSTLDPRPSFETYDLSLAEEFPGIFRLEGQGAGPWNGAVIATSHNEVSAYTETDAFAGRSLAGRVDSSGQTMLLKGVDQHGAKISIRAQKQ